MPSPGWPTSPQRRGGLRRPPRHPGRPSRRPAAGARQQGVDHRRCSGGPARPGHAGCRARARRLGALCAPPVPASRGPLDTSPACCSRRRVGRSVAAAATSSRGWGCPRPSPIRPGHGSQGHHRLVDPHEQGPRGHRGPRALRHRLRRRRGGGAPAVRGPLDGRVRGRRDHGPALAARHAAAHRLRPGLPRPLGPAVRGRRLDHLGTLTSKRPTAACSRASTSPSGPDGRETWPPPG